MLRYLDQFETGKAWWGLSRKPSLQASPSHLRLAGGRPGFIIRGATTRLETEKLPGSLIARLNAERLLYGFLCLLDRHPRIQASNREAAQW